MRLEYFELIDRIVDLNLTDKTIRVEAQVPTESTIFDGHFPGYPLMPGVLLCEAMAQTSGWLIMGLEKFARMPFLASLREAKFRNFVRPGQKLDLSARITHDGSGFTVAEAKGEVGGRVVCEATITFRLAPFPSISISDAMKEFGKKIDFPFGAIAHD